MATVTSKLLTADEFYEWANRPRNRNKLHELDEGEIIEMPSPGELHGAVCCFIAYLLTKYVMERGKGYVCSNDTGLLIKRKPGTIRGPDIMLFDESVPISKLSRRFTIRVPRLVVEVMSPSDTMTKMNRRISQFLKRGIPLVWLVDPETRTVTVYRPGENLEVLRGTDELTGDDVLPKLRYRVEDLFALPGQ